MIRRALRHTRPAASCADRDRTEDVISRSASNADSGCYPCRSRVCLLLESAGERLARRPDARSRRALLSGIASARRYSYSPPFSYSSLTLRVRVRCWLPVRCRRAQQHALPQQAAVEIAMAEGHAQHNAFGNDGLLMGKLSPPVGLYHSLDETHGRCVIRRTVSDFFVDSLADFPWARLEQARPQVSSQDRSKYHPSVDDSMGLSSMRITLPSRALRTVDFLCLGLRINLGNDFSNGVQSAGTEEDESWKLSSSAPYRARCSISLRDGFRLAFQVTDGIYNICRSFDHVSGLLASECSPAEPSEKDQTGDKTMHAHAAIDETDVDKGQMVHDPCHARRLDKSSLQGYCARKVEKDVPAWLRGAGPANSLTERRSTDGASVIVALLKQAAQQRESSLCSDSWRSDKHKNNALSRLSQTRDVASQPNDALGVSMQSNGMLIGGRGARGSRLLTQYGGKHDGFTVSWMCARTDATAASRLVSSYHTAGTHEWLDGAARLEAIRNDLAWQLANLSL
ncbi:hypothetical protein MRB53_039473 [Persea americana]|nr:hypothetical protein MRB53_039473 [Persea americana]